MMWLVEPEKPGTMFMSDRSEASPFTPRVVPVGTPPVACASSITPLRSKTVPVSYTHLTLPTKA